MKSERPRRPKGRPLNALTAPSIPIFVAAAETRISEDDLLEATEDGWMPPWVAAKAAILPRASTMPAQLLWRFSAQITRKEIEQHLRTKWLWLDRVHLDDSDLTAAWFADPDTAPVDVAQIAEWCRCARPNGLAATPGMFAVWCEDHPYGARFTAHRHETLTRWFSMLRTAGSIIDLGPSAGTSVEALANV